MSTYFTTLSPSGHAAAVDPATLGVWQTYVPVWAASGTAPVPNNAVMVGRYCQVGKLVVGNVSVVMGSTTTYGTGAYTFSLPVPAAYVGSIAWDIGRVLMYDASAVTAVIGDLFLNNATTLNAQWPVTYPQAALSQLQSTVPFTWAVGDIFRGQFVYEAA